MDEIIFNKYKLTKEKKPTRRGVIWLGQTCNLNCYFCYFAARIANKNHPEHPFFGINKAKEMCFFLRNEYNLNSIDIQGGEPTIYPKIFNLIDYCNEIGLKPTLITNGIRLSNYNLCKKYKEHNVYDFLFSIQGIGKKYDEVVGLNGAFKKQIKALNNLKNLEIPIRFNAVLSNEILDDLNKINRLIKNYYPRVVNFIGYNNTGDQAKMRTKEQIPYYKLVKEKLEPVIKDLEENNIEVNVRFLPFCIFNDRYRKNIQNQKQMIYDLHEWEKSSRIWTDRPAQRRAAENTEIRKNEVITLIKKKIRNKMILSVIKNIIPRYKSYKRPYQYQNKILKNLLFYFPSKYYGKIFSKIEHFYFDLKEVNCKKTKGKKCKNCDLSEICDGIHSDYIETFGEKEFEAIEVGNKIIDPLYYMKHQYKVVEKEEKDWF